MLFFSSLEICLKKFDLVLIKILFYQAAAAEDDDVDLFGEETEEEKKAAEERAAAVKAAGKKKECEYSGIFYGAFILPHCLLSHWC